MPRRLGRIYFALQAAAGAGWWIGVFTLPWVREVTLGDLPVILVAALDIPLFVVGSALVAAGVRGAVWVVVPWTLLVTVSLGAYATFTTRAGWGAALMVAATIAGIGAGMLVWFGRIPMERFLIGPLGFGTARPASPAAHFGRTLLQIAVFWGLFLGIFPLIITVFEHRWELHVELPAGVTIAGIVILVAASALGFWSAFAISTRGDGTPLPSAATTRLVIAGPYRFVRNPMAIAGLAQGAAVGLIIQSWPVVIYAIVGSVVWNWLVRPIEETELAEKFGGDYEVYRRRVRCWVPRFSGSAQGAEQVGHEDVPTFS